MNFLLDLFLGPRIERRTQRHLHELARQPIESSRTSAKVSLAQLRNQPGPQVTLGHTAWGEPVVIPLAEVIGRHGLITGSTGAGKSMAVLLLVDKFLEVARSS